jgi:uncharacterized membrane protein
MENHLIQILSLLVRMLHFITGVAWIGASFYFNWLENALERQNQREEIAGSLWAVHGGGFYYVEKYKLAPKRLPSVLHWFKWEAYTTWMSGFALLILVYYLQAQSYLSIPGDNRFSSAFLIGMGLATIAGGWICYDQLCKSPIGRDNRVLAVVIFVATLAIAFALSKIMNPRAMFMHIGAMLGTCMAANVFFVIIPSQKNLVEAASRSEVPDAAKAKNALQRSRHNNYLTLPVLFVMISNHFPFTYSHPLSWLLLGLLGLSGALVRHWFNLKGKGIRNPWLLPAAGALIVIVGFMTAPRDLAHGDAIQKITEGEVHAIIQQRCVACHSQNPSDDVFTIAPAGLVLDTYDQSLIAIDRIYERSVVSENMPFANKTGMKPEERAVLKHWYQQIKNHQH